MQSQNPSGAAITLLRVVENNRELAAAESYMREQARTLPRRNQILSFGGSRERHCRGVENKTARDRGHDNSWTHGLDGSHFGKCGSACHA